MLMVGMLGAVAGAAAVVLIRPASPVVGDVPQMTAIDTALDRRLSDVWFEDLPLDQAVARISQQSGISIELERRSHFTETTYSLPTTVRLRNATLAEVLDALVASVGQSVGPNWISYIALPDRILITSDKDLEESYGVLRSYDLRNMLRQTTEAVPSGTTVAGSSLPQGSDSSMISEQSAEDGLFEFMQHLMDQPNWRIPSGDTGRMFIYGGRLVAYQTPRRHRSILKAIARWQKPIAIPSETTLQLASERWHPELKGWVSNSSAATEKEMETVVDEFRAESEPFDSAVRRLCQKAGVRVVFRTDGLQEWWLKRSTTVGIRKRTLADALEAVFKGASPELTYAEGVGLEYEWFLDGEVLVVGRYESYQGAAMETRIYDVRDIAVLVDATTPLSLQTQKSGGLFANSGSTDNLKDMVVAAMDYPKGSKSGEVTNLGGRLVVTQTAPNHRIVKALLARLRAAIKNGEADPIPGLVSTTRPTDTGAGERLDE